MLKRLVYWAVALSCAACGSSIQDSPGLSDSSGPSYGVDVKPRVREDAIRRAKVWKAPATPIERVNFLEGEAISGAIRSDASITCKWDFATPLGGMTSKFLCKTNSGDVLKVKYAREGLNNNAEIPAEIVSSRLLRALGFGADLMYTAARIRCLGCPKDPWVHTYQLHSPFETARKSYLANHGRTDSRGNLYYEADYSKFTDFTYVSIERRFGAHSIEVNGAEGWSFKELQDVSVSRGGSSRAEIDALILLTAFIQHTDSKKAQQRVVCMGELTKAGYCAEPMLILHDLGATLGGPYRKGLVGGHDKFNVENWRTATIWRDPSSCVVDFRDAKNGTFEATQVTEEGRLFLVSLLNRLSDRQIYDLFAGARAGEFHRATNREAYLTSWVEAFKKRRAMIADHSPCQ